MTTTSKFTPSEAFLELYSSLQVMELPEALLLQRREIPAKSMEMPSMVLQPPAGFGCGAEVGGMANGRNEGGVQAGDYTLVRVTKMLKHTELISQQTFDNVFDMLKSKYQLHMLQFGHKKVVPGFGIGIGKVADGGLFIYYLVDDVRHLQFVGPGYQMWRLGSPDLDALLSTAQKDQFIRLKKQIVCAQLNRYFQELNELPHVRVVSWLDNKSSEFPLEVTTALDLAILLMQERYTLIGDAQDLLLQEYRAFCDENPTTAIRELAESGHMVELNKLYRHQGFHLSSSKQLQMAESISGVSSLAAPVVS